MKNILAKFAVATIALFSTVACVEDGTNTTGTQNHYDTFIAESEIMVFVDGTVVKSYDKSQDQVIYNDAGTLFMLSDMNYTSQFTITIGGELTLDNSIVINYKSNISDDLASGSLTMSVVKVDEDDSRYWLWSNDSSIGFIIDLDF